MRSKADLHRWMRESPLPIKSLMVDFPPSCVVMRSKGSDLELPTPGSASVVMSYGRLPCGCASLRILDYGVWMNFREDPSNILECHPHNLVVIDYYSNVTPDWVRQVFQGADMPIWEN